MRCCNPQPLSIQQPHQHYCYSTARTPRSMVCYSFITFPAFSRKTNTHACSWFLFFRCAPVEVDSNAVRSSTKKNRVRPVASPIFCTARIRRTICISYTASVPTQPCRKATCVRNGCYSLLLSTRNSKRPWKLQPPQQLNQVKLPRRFFYRHTTPTVQATSLDWNLCREKTLPETKHLSVSYRYPHHLTAPTPAAGSNWVHPKMNGNPTHL